MCPVGPCPRATSGICVFAAMGAGVSQSCHLLSPSQGHPTLSLHLGPGHLRLVANPNPRLRREDSPRLPPPVAPRLPPIPHSTGVLFLGGTEKAVRTQEVGGGQLYSVQLREHRHLGFLEDSTLPYSHSFLEP